MEPFKRIVVYAGHYGCGKTNLSANTALALRRAGREVSVLDLDIVNPFFRTADRADEFRREGIRLISSEYANTNVDIPALPPAMYSIFDDESRSAVIDVGGDDAGAVALGRFARQINGNPDAEVLLVINKYRPLAETPEEMAEIARDVERVCRVRFTAIAANHNLGHETTARTVLDGEEYTLGLSRLMGLPVKFRSANERLMPELEGRLPDLMPIRPWNKFDF